jgi:hypothetical protein
MISAKRIVPKSSFFILLPPLSTISDFFFVDKILILHRSRQTFPSLIHNV